MVGAAVLAVPFADVEGFSAAVLSADTAHPAAGIPAVDDDQLTAVPIALVFEHGAELAPRGVRDAPVQSTFRGLPVVQVCARLVGVGTWFDAAAHALHVQVLDADGLVLAHQFRGQLVQEVAALVPDLRVDSRDLEPRLAIIAASSLFSGQFPLRPAQSVELPLPITGIVDLGAVAQDGEPVEAHVDADVAVGRFELLDVVLAEDADMPSPGGVEADGDGGRLGLARQRARPSDVQRLPHFGEFQRPPTPIPCECVSGERGAAAIPLGFEPGIAARMVEEVRVGGLQMPERLLQGNA